jgi:muramoyltetrapeptide carboxypeptidase
MVELAAGVERLRPEGFDVRVHAQCARQHFTFAGTDQERSGAFVEYAYAGDVDVIWCARGGYGATRLLPTLDAVTRTRGKPMRKLLVGYSDVTVLHEYVRTRWGWATLHAAMPASVSFGQFDPSHWEATLRLVRGEPVDTPWQSPLGFVGVGPVESIEGELVGGTLTLWACLMGTPHAPNGRGKILFFEDVGEAWYRVDRMVTQLRQAGAFDGVRAIVLGDFKDCKDEVHMVRREAGSEAKVPLRKFFKVREAVEEIFGQLGVPLARGLPVGHGPNFAPLPLGARYRLSPDGRLSLLQWDWHASRPAGAVAE